MRDYISCSDVSYCLPDGRTLFSSINRSFNAERTALVGPNGIGKTTLLELLAGLKLPASGSISRSGRAEILRQTEKFDGEDCVADALGVADALRALDLIVCGTGTPADLQAVENSWDLPDRIKLIFGQVGIDNIGVDRPLRSLSEGELMRVRIAGLLLSAPEFLLLDEPTNHLDLTGRSFIYEVIRSWRRGLVVVSHDRRLLAEVDCIVELNSTGLKAYGGNFEFYRERREIENCAAREALDSAKQRLKHAEAAAIAARERQQRRQASGRYRKLRTGMPKMMAGNLRRRAEVTAGKLSDQHDLRVKDAATAVQFAKRSIPVDEHIRVDLNCSVIPAARRLMELDNVNYRYPESAIDLWRAPISLKVVGPERIWLKGPNGSGKSTLIDLICGKMHQSTGKITIAATRIGLLDQRVSVLNDRLSLLENIRRTAPKRPVSEIRTLLGRFLFAQDAALKPTGGLSGGERMRAGLACLLAADQAPELLILDEPANNLDLQTIETVASAIADFRGAMIVVSHDVDFLSDIGIDRAFDMESFPAS